LALRLIELQAGVLKLLEHFPQVEQVLLERAANHDHAIRYMRLDS
jgi:hypothetical protein